MFPPGRRKLGVTMAAVDTADTAKQAEQIRLSATLRRAFRESQLAATQALARCGLSEQRYHLLLELAAAGEEGQVQGELAADLHCPETRISLLVRELSETGLVTTSRRAPDRRQVVVRLTPEGGRQLARAVRAQRDALAAMAASLPLDGIVEMLQTALRAYLGVEAEIKIRRAAAPSG
jgi:DNA-binding MarR family transcriptional regulator